MGNTILDGLTRRELRILLTAIAQRKAQVIAGRLVPVRRIQLGAYRFDAYAYNAEVYVKLAFPARGHIATLPEAEIRSTLTRKNLALMAWIEGLESSHGASLASILLKGNSIPVDGR